MCVQGTGNPVLYPLVKSTFESVFYNDLLGVSKICSFSTATGYAKFHWVC